MLRHEKSSLSYVVLRGSGVGVEFLYHLCAGGNGCGSFFCGRGYGCGSGGYGGCSRHGYGGHLGGGGVFAVPRRNG